MSKLNQLGWVAEDEYDIDGFPFALRSTAAAFIHEARNTLTPYRIRATAPLWPVFSITAPPARPDARSVGRQLHVGYHNHVEAFRYADVHDAQAALLGRIHLAAVNHFAEQRGLIAAEGIVIGGRAVLLYGPHARWCAAQLAENITGAAELSSGTTMVDVATGIVCPWPLRIERWPSELDRRGVPLAPLGELVDVPARQPVAVAAVVRAAAGRVTRPVVVAELMSASTTSAPRPRLFRCLVGLVARARILAAPTPTARAIAPIREALKCDLGPWEQA